MFKAITKHFDKLAFKSLQPQDVLTEIFVSLNSSLLYSKHEIFSKNNRSCVYHIVWWEWVARAAGVVPGQ